MKRTSTILKMIKENRESEWYPSTGLCTIINHLYGNGKITEGEYLKTRGTLRRFKPRDNPDFYMGHWFPEDGVERGKFLDKLIKKYSARRKRASKKIFLR